MLSFVAVEPLGVRASSWADLQVRMSSQDFLGIVKVNHPLLEIFWRELIVATTAWFLEAKIQGEVAEGKVRAKVGVEVAPVEGILHMGGRVASKNLQWTQPLQATEASSKSILDKEAQIKSAEDKLGRL